MARCLRARSESLTVDTDIATFRISRGALVTQGEVGGRPVVSGLAARLTDAAGRVHQSRISRIVREATGPVRVTVRFEGSFGGAAPCHFIARLCFFAGTGLVRVRLTLHNPRRARHAGGLWDLGDANSMLFRDLSLVWGLLDRRGTNVDWRAEADDPVQTGVSERVEIYQDSSGGVNWDSRNHANRDGQVACSFRGYQVRAGGSERRGFRASPVVTVRGTGATLAVAIPEFWQQFPKAVEADNGELRVRLFPGQFGDLHELQGGEQKTHTVWFNVGGTNSSPSALAWVHGPALARATPEWYSTSGEFPQVGPANSDRPSRLDDYLSASIEGDKSLFAGREVIDEYGWRNYGEIYADHESAYYRGPAPVISHFNNQYDSVYGAILQFVRTGDRRWWEVAAPLARHVADIDVYHTTEDKAAYNGGLFWFTDHYMDAATCTHRTYSRTNRPLDGRPYGGGPGSCHNFTSGLAYYYYLTGDPVVREAALSLADWVMAMDDGRRNILGLIDPRPTGLASCTSEPDYHGPGRGPGLSVNALLDGWQLTGRSAYLEKAEELIQRVAHPADDIAARDLLNVELRWSYPIFFVAVDRYLEMKADAGQLDSRHAYARACLLHYAAWMVDHELPYLHRSEMLEFPTETWAAQDLRKANVLRLAAAHADEPLRGRLISRAVALADRAWEDLDRFANPTTARAVAILMVEGTRDQRFRAGPIGDAPRPAAAYSFGRPTAFVPQMARIRAQLKSVRGLARAVAGVVNPFRWQSYLCGS